MRRGTVVFLKQTGEKFRVRRDLDVYVEVFGPGHSQPRRYRRSALATGQGQWSR